jgi:hypothetical protein
MQPAMSGEAAAHDHDHDYSGLLAGVKASFEAAVTPGARLFATGARRLNEIYLDWLPTERQIHNCHCCRRFLETYGGLVTIDEAGNTRAAMWDPDKVPDFYKPAFRMLRKHVEAMEVISPFLTKQKVWGNPVTGKWSHMAVMPPAQLVYSGRALDAKQAMAAARENFRTVSTALSQFTAPMLDEALRLLEADALARSEKFVGPVRWLRQLQDRSKGPRGENVLWRAIASAPEGYCHPKSSVIGPLLEDIAAGLPFEDIRRRFNAKLHPLQYQRPQAPPTAGNIAAAEALVAKLGIAPALERRFAKLEELQTIWRPAEPKPEKAGGVFAHLKPKAAGSVARSELPQTTMTWSKFAKTVLPKAERIEIMVPRVGRFIALTTAVHPDAPPILKWDRESERNPVAWYVYPSGSSAHQWQLVAGFWAQVTAVAPFPTMWGSSPMPYLGEGVVLVIAGAIDTQDAGNAIFPETLRDELHGIRSTIEAHSRSAKMQGRAEASACGLDVRREQADCQLRAFVSGAWAPYRIDRWD